MFRSGSAVSSCLTNTAHAHKLASRPFGNDVPVTDPSSVLRLFGNPDMPAKRQSPDLSNMIKAVESADEITLITLREFHILCELRSDVDN